jgi:O-antigen ligase
LAVLQYYSEYDWVNKLIGGGLSADVTATDKYSLAFGLENSRAHNSFLYVLVCLGALGFAVFCFILLGWIYNIIRAMRFWDEPIVIVSLVLLITFFVFSLTTEAIIRAQIMIPLSFFMGRLVLFNIGVRGI